jgi:predicted dehydrogenase
LLIAHIQLPTAMHLVAPFARNLQSPAALTRRAFVSIGATAVGTLSCPHIVRSGVLARGQSAGRRLNVAIIGCGNRARSLIPPLLDMGNDIVALCDPDAAQLARLQAGKLGLGDRRNLPPEYLAALASAKEGLAKAKVYDDYRRLLERERSLDAVLIAAGPRWHVPMCKAALQAGLHVYCEKPLALSVAQTREIALLMRGKTLVTQSGTQGGATDAFRRSMEIIQAGLLGQIHAVHCWIKQTVPPSAPFARDADPIPVGLNWDAWCGPAPMRPFKANYLGGVQNWFRWLDFGGGFVADMGAHALNLPVRALQLGPPSRISVQSSEPVQDSYPSKNRFRWDFPARKERDPVSVWWHDGFDAGPPQEVAGDVVATYGKVPSSGCLFVGSKGSLCADAWGQRGVMRLKDDANPKARGVLDHEAAKSVPVTYPRAPGQDHLAEFVEACRGGPTTFQNLAFAAEAAEIAMTGLVALRVGREIDWDSRNLHARGCPEADRWIHLPQRKKWLA